MATARTSQLPNLDPGVIRPALAEAKLMTEKRTRDAVYVITLTEDLRNIELKIAATEEGLPLASPAAAIGLGTFLAPTDRMDANWIRTKSGELDLRLRRFEESSKRLKLPHRY